MKLIGALALLEIKRLLGRLWLLFAIVAFLFLGLNLQIGDFTFLSQVESRGERSVFEFKNNMDFIQSALPKIAMMVMALLSGVILLATAPFRGSEHWRSGGFQIYFMCDHSFYKIEAIRYLILLALGMVFFFLVQGLFGASLLGTPSFTFSYYTKTVLFLGLWFFSGLAVFIGLGSLVSAVLTAYLHRGQSPLLKVLFILGILEFTSRFYDLALYMASKDYASLLPIPFIFAGEGLLKQELIFPFEWFLGAVFLSLLFLMWGSRIYQEVES